jgi:hypothetical protein
MVDLDLNPITKITLVGLLFPYILLAKWSEILSKKLLTLIFVHLHFHEIFCQFWYVFVQTYIIHNVTLVVEMKDKEFTSHKAKHALQFDTNIFLI